MLTWRLWQALRFPDEEHVLFRRLQRQSIALPGQVLFRPVTRSRIFQWFWRILMALLPAVVIVIAPAALLLTSNLFGALVAFNVMSTISREREQGTYDLLALTPIGLGAANWLVAAAWTQRLAAVDRLASVRTLTIILLTLLLVSSLGGERLTPVLVVALLVGLNVDAIQSLIVGCLSGMLAQRFDDVGSPFVALAVFAFVQIILVYLPVATAAILLNELLLRAALTPLLNDVIFAGVLVGLLFGLREAIIRLMWRDLERRLL